MPLIKGKSKKSFDKNMKAEMESGKPKDQALAIAYSVQKQARKKKMAMGGMVENDEREFKMLDAHPTMHDQEQDLRKRKRTTIDDAASDRNEMMLDSHPTRHSGELLAKDEHHADEDDSDDREMQMLARGGMVNGSDISRPPMSMIETIMERRRKLPKGESDLNRNADEDLNYEDQLSFDAARQQVYAEEPALEEASHPMNSNMHGHELEDEHDMVSKIRSKIKAKRM